MAAAKPPTYLSTNAKKIWRSVLPLLSSKEPTPVHLHQLEMYCQSIAEYREYTETIGKDGAVYEDKNGMDRKHPLLVSQAKALDMATKMANELGLSRKKVAVVEKPSAKTRSLRKPQRGSKVG